MSDHPLHPCKVLITPKTYDIEHKYINLGCLKVRHGVKHNSNSMVRGAFSSHPRYHLPTKRTTVSYQNPTLQTFSSPKHTPEQTWEKTTIIRSRAKLRLIMLKMPSFEGNRSLTPVRAPSRASIPHSHLGGELSTSLQIGPQDALFFFFFPSETKSGCPPDTVKPW